MPFTVAGETGAIFGQGDGSFEAWIFPVKIASHFRITAELDGYPIPIELSDYAATIEVNPDRTTLTYSHAAFTVKQHMFSSAAGPVVFFEIASARPLTLTFRFTPEMLRMWPAPNFGLPSAEWMKDGYYILHTDSPAFSGCIGIPGAVPGILAPYQERPRTWPLELRLSFDPKTQSHQFFPLLMAVTPAQLLDLNKTWPAQYQKTAEHYAHFFDHKLTAETPDASFNLALRWAELAIDQAQVRFHTETGLVAGYYSSADSARPGFAWFFGRDTLFSLYAVHSYGDFALSRRALEFLLHRQRADGKIMHEFSQTADLVDWPATPYFYASADSTPLLVMTMWDYVRSSGDVDFLRAHWSEIKKAWAFRWRRHLRKHRRHRLGRKLALRHAASGNLFGGTRPAILRGHGQACIGNERTGARRASRQTSRVDRIENRFRILRHRILRVQPQRRRHARPHRDGFSQCRLVGRHVRAASCGENVRTLGLARIFHRLGRPRCQPRGIDL
jgi:hypothetical protein